MTSNADHPVFQPFQLGSLRLRNRVIKTATFEGMVANGAPAETLLRHHREIAAGGVGMTTVAYCAVSANGRTFEKQMYMRPELRPALRRLTCAIHDEGAAASIQLGHCGGFSKNKALTTPRPLAPSFGVNVYGIASGMVFAGKMSHAEIESTTEAFAAAAVQAREAGFDAVELHLGHGYLLSQFISPIYNRRKDEYGGSIDNRMRFPRMVVRRVRQVLGPEFPVLAKINLSDGLPKGLTHEDAVRGAAMLEEDGVSALITSGGLVARTPFYLLRGQVPLAEMIDVEPSRLQRLALRGFGSRLPSHEFSPTFFLEPARALREAVSVPIVLLGGVTGLDDMTRAMEAGFELVAMGRALLHDPNLVEKLRAGTATRTGCEPCNQCITEMDRPGGVCCAKVPWQLERRAEEVAAGAHERSC